jgi:hypothetical protein
MKNQIHQSPSESKAALLKALSLAATKEYKTQVEKYDKTHNIVNTVWNYNRTNYAITLQRYINGKDQYSIVTNGSILHSKEYEYVFAPYISND